MRPAPGEVLHFSEDPSLVSFEPRDGAVWAVGADRAQDFWFPRDCPRVLAWVSDRTTDADRELIGGLRRIHLIEHGWVDRMASTTLYAYRLPAGPFTPAPGDPSPSLVAAVPVAPLGPPVAVGDLLGLHAAAGIVLQAVDNLWPHMDRVVDTTLEFSGIRLRNALPREG